MIDGRFELLSRLGGGGMGLVWRARDLALHREVALKEVRPPDPDLAEYDPEASEALRARVLREARALARIVHPNVVTIHHIVDGGEEGTYPWLVMELVPGGSLQDRIDRGRLTPGEAAALGRGVLEGLRAAHAADIQHRDIKPPNILLRPDGRAVLTDFGIAAIRGSTTLTATGSVIGTPDYMAPERVAGQGGGPAADLWSLAMTLYVAVEGHNPMRRGNTLATLAAVLGEEVPPPRRAGALTGLLTSVLVRDPAARPDAATLDRLLAEAEAAARFEATKATEAATGSETSYPLTPPRTTAPQPPPEPPVPGSGASTREAPPWMPTAPPVSSASTPPSSPPGPAGPTPPPSASPSHAEPFFGVPHPTPAQALPVRRKRTWIYASGLGAVALAGVLLWALLPLGDGSGGDKTEADGGTSPKPGTSGGSSQQPVDSSGKKITIGVKYDQPGLGYMGPDGKPLGFDVDVATYIAKRLGHAPSDIVWKQVRGIEREGVLQRGEVDFLVAVYAMNDTRAKKVDFVGPYLEAHQDVLLPEDAPAVTTAADLNGKSVCTVAGSSSGTNLRTQAAQARLVERDTYYSCIDDLVAGKVDAVTADDALLAGYATQVPQDLKLGGLKLSDERYGIGLRKGSELKGKVETALKDMIKDGSWQASLNGNLSLLKSPPPQL
ncbi:transporter substrate-binding domain-containing protein [Streptomyces sp. NA04227]|uniref:bifunctional serine/threonine-protein kinase/glutamate ABC transporter substrate-binding protein n=1 Tax=Streptomyces sp. NA04227 TaxID=2742136 RepID=UPI0015910EDC|nr:bifunctional serine/threonine-protein kinase/glutamate ABC transporter substrate-binding protein [Streptomyces sp. NA04227]QKW11308.1 transporter substrate-binding domain-containing protein [Streptomyces sp. NA04227]